MSGVSQAQTDYNKLQNTTDTRSDTTWDRASEDYAPAFAGYSDYAAGGGLTQADKDRMQAAVDGIGGGGGGISNPLSGKASAYQNLNSAYLSAYRPDYSEADTGFRNLASSTGGFNADQLNQIYGNIGQLTNIGQTGGITDEDKSNINRQSILDQEATGGYSDQDKALIRAKSAASSPAYFSALKDNLQRQRGVSGNLANAGAVDFKTARQSAQQQASDRINAEIGLQESIRTGKQQAGDFLSQQGLSLAGLRTANEMAAAKDAAAQGTSTQQAITANQLQGLQGLQTSQTGLGQWGLGQAGGLDQFGLTKAGGLDQYAETNAQLDMSAASANASAGRAQAAANAQYQQWLTEYGNQQKQYGIGGLTDLYKTNLGASQGYTGQSLDALSGKYGAEGNLLGVASANRGKTLGENAAGYGKIAAAAAATYFTGGAAAPMLAGAVSDQFSSGAPGSYNYSGAAPAPADYGFSGG